MAKVIHTSGKRKSSIARATLKEGKGNVRINGIMLDIFQPEMARLKIREPLLLAKDIADKADISVVVRGGGIISGADAARQAIARALVEYGGKAALKEKFVKYDRTLLVSDVRLKEKCKPNISKARAKRQKSYRERGQKNENTKKMLQLRKTNRSVMGRFQEESRKWRGRKESHGRTWPR